MVHPYGYVSSSDKVPNPDTIGRGKNREGTALLEASNPGKGEDWIIWLTQVNIRKRRNEQQAKEADRLEPKR